MCQHSALQTVKPWNTKQNRAHQQIFHKSNRCIRWRKVLWRPRNHLVASYWIYWNKRAPPPNLNTIRIYNFAAKHSTHCCWWHPCLPEVMAVAESFVTKKFCSEIESAMGAIWSIKGDKTVWTILQMGLQYVTKYCLGGTNNHCSTTSTQFVCWYVNRYCLGGTNNHCSTTSVQCVWYDVGSSIPRTPRQPPAIRSSTLLLVRAPLWSQWALSWLAAGRLSLF